MGVVATMGLGALIGLTSTDSCSSAWGAGRPSQRVSTSDCTSPPNPRSKSTGSCRQGLLAATGSTRATRWRTVLPAGSVTRRVVLDARAAVPPTLSLDAALGVSGPTEPLRRRGCLIDEAE